MSASYSSDSGKTVFNLTTREGTGGARILREFVEHLREVAAERDVKVPNNIGCGGKWGEQIYVVHNRIVLRELVRELGKDFDGLEMI